MTIKLKKFITFAWPFITALPVPVWAHHAMEGATPTTALHGLLSGLAHPVLGIDHLVFVLSIGLVAGFANLRWPWLPILFVLSTLLGTATLISGFNFMFAEACVAASVLAAGALISGFNFMFAEACVAASVLAAGALLFRNGTTPRSALILFGAVAGLFHGYLYAEAIVGAETSPLVAYLVGFGIIQMLISSSAYAGSLRLKRAFPEVLPRIKIAAGTAVGLTGIALLSSLVVA